jgi:hypothetical protein
MTKALLNGKPLSAALAFVKMIVPLAPFALALFSHVRGCPLAHQECAESRFFAPVADVWPKLPQSRSAARTIWCSAGSLTDGVWHSAISSSVHIRH